MKGFARLFAYAVALAAPLAPTVADAANVIAHRGVFHDTDSTKTLPENSYDAVVRAYDLGLRGVELDLRLDSDGSPLVIHDLIGNRSTEADNYGGKMNAVEVSLKNQSNVSEVHLSEHDDEYWRSKKLKSYGRNADMFYPSLSGDLVHVQSLYSMFKALQANRPEILSSSNFMIILDIQSPSLFDKAAKEVRGFKLQNVVYLKFFVSKGLWNDPKFVDKSTTCYTYEKNNNLLGLKIIPQINDGELDFEENDEGGIKAFQTTLKINDYLDCFAAAEKGHQDAAKMPIVSASVPANNSKATTAAYDAFQWARDNKRETMAIIPNPDAGRKVGGVCKLYQFRSDSNAAASFNTDARTAKTSLAEMSKVEYIVWDVMGDVKNKTYYTSAKTFDDNLC